MNHLLRASAIATLIPVTSATADPIPQHGSNVSACVSDAPCIDYLDQDGAFGVLPVRQ